jgi:hypothetical protein
MLASPLLPNLTFRSDARSRPESVPFVGCAQGHRTMGIARFLFHSLPNVTGQVPTTDVD